MKRAHRWLIVWLLIGLALVGVWFFSRSLKSRPHSPPISQSRVYNGPFHLLLLLYNRLLSANDKNQLLEMGPFQLRIVAADPHLDSYDSQVKALGEVKKEGVEKLIGFSSYKRLEKKLSQPGPPGFSTHADYLKSIGVVGFTYNTETSPRRILWTPQEEMDSLFSSDPQTNSVANFARIVKSYGFDLAVWVPYRFTADGYFARQQRAPNYKQALAVMYQAGLDGVGLQEQNYLDKRCVNDLAEAFKETFSLHQEVAGGRKPYILVNIYLSGCLAGDEYAAANCDLDLSYRWQHCHEFISQISQDLGTLSVSHQDTGELLDFFRLLRKGSL